MRATAALVAGALLLAGCGATSSPPPASPSAVAPWPTLAPSTASPPPAPSTPAATPTPPCTQSSALDAWSLQRLAAQTLVVPADVEDLAAARPDARRGVGGIVLFGSRPPSDLAAQLAALRRSASGHVAPFVSADEEGGAIQRLRAVVGDVPSARTMAATLTPAQVRRLARRIGSAMLGSGVDVDLAPVLDLDAGPGPDAQHPDGTRSFSDDPGRASRYGLAFAEGLADAGVVAVVKHAPGLGGATGNTDTSGATTRPWSTISASDLVPFRDAVDAGVPAVMVANASVPGLTPLPASLAPEVVDDVLRRQLGFDGVVMTDSLSAQAIADAGYSVPQAAVAALAAGDDMVLFGHRGAEPATTTAVIAALVQAVQDGRLPRERLRQAVLRILDLKHVDLCRAG